MGIYPEEGIMVQKLFNHEFAIGSKKYLVVLPDYYQGNGGGGTGNIGSAMGITKIDPATEINPDDYDSLTIGEGLKAGMLLRMRISYEDGTKTKSARIVCPIDKAKAAKASLLGKTYKGKNIISAGIPRRRRLG